MSAKKSDCKSQHRVIWLKSLEGRHPFDAFELTELDV